MVKFHMPHFHLHHHHDKRFEENNDIPKGYLAVMVGLGEEQQRFVIPITCLNHPLFRKLLKESEEEYGLHQKGPIAIPRPVEEFRNIHNMIDQDKAFFHRHHGWCF